MTERRELESVIYEREPPIARIILNRPDKANTKDAQPGAGGRRLPARGRPRQRDQGRDPQGQRQGLLRRPRRAAGAPTRTRTRTSGTRSRTCTRAPPTCSCGRRCICGSSRSRRSPRSTATAWAAASISGLLTDFCVASEDAYFQMPLAQSLGEPGGHTMIEPWLMMNWHRTMDWLLLAPTLSAQEALDWGLLNKVVPRDDLEDTVEEMARKIGQIPLTTLMAVKNNVKRAWELMGMRVHLQVSHILTNMVGAASDVQARRAELIQSGLKPRDFVDEARKAPSARREACGPPRGGPRRSRTPSCWRCCRPHPDTFGPSPWR